jgi:hypothetical protein
MSITNGRPERKDVTERLELLKKETAEADRRAAEKRAEERANASSR